MLDLLAQPATQPCVWTSTDVVVVLTCIAGTLIPSIIALRKAWKTEGKAEVQGVALAQQHHKINELAEKNPADVSPLPPLPIDGKTDI